MDEWSIPEYSEFETALTTAPGIKMWMNSTLSDPKEMAGVAVECRELMMVYACALKEMQIRFEILSMEFLMPHTNAIRSLRFTPGSRAPPAL